jgi:hypothetical protein
MARYEELHYRLRSLAATFPDALSFETIDTVGANEKRYDIVRLTVQKGPLEGKLRVCLAFGTHGSEDLTVEATVEFLQSLVDTSYMNPLLSLPSHEERLKLLNQFSFIIYFFNPIGLDRTERSNGHRHDLNRWFGKPDAPKEVQAVVDDLKNHSFDFCIDLHGDVTGEGFMIYEHTRLPYSIAEDIIDALRVHKVRIAADGENGGEMIEHGVIHTPAFAHAFDDYLFYEKGVRVALTLEYPGKDNPENDIQYMVTSLYTALMLFRKL